VVSVQISDASFAGYRFHPLIACRAPQKVREKGGLSGRIIRADSDKPISGVRPSLLSRFAS
jgi:hypothetical protein